MALYSVGHSTLAADQLADLLTGAAVAAVVDVRRFPASRRHPQFELDAMRRWLPAAGLAYRWDERLGGRRRRRPDSLNVGLRNAAFQGYADHMATPAFRDALEVVVDEAARATVALLCAEGLWWRCHRRLIADAATLLAGCPVRHLMPDGSSVAHPPTDAARVVDGLVLYDRRVQPPLL